MTSFEFVFSLFGLVLGLSLSTVLGGFANAINLRRHAARIGVSATRIGWRTPLLAIFLAIDITGFWFIAWRARDAIPAVPASLYFGLVITGLYYLAASWVFPIERPEGEDLDKHFLEVKRSVLGLALLCNLLAHGARLMLVGPVALGFNRPQVRIELGIYFATLTVAAFVRNPKISVPALVLLFFVYGLDIVGSFLPPPAA